MSLNILIRLIKEEQYEKTFNFYFVFNYDVSTNAFIVCLW